MTTLQIADETRTIANLLHCATQYEDRYPERADALRKEAAERQAALDALAAPVAPTIDRPSDEAVGDSPTDHESPGTDPNPAT